MRDLQPGTLAENPRSKRLARPVTIVLRIATAALCGAMAAIHAHLWATGYRHIPTIGDLFLLDAISGLALATAVLIAPSRLLPAAAAASALAEAGTLGALLLSLHSGIFGFKEFAGAPFLNASYAVESAGVVAASLLAAVAVRQRPPPPEAQPPRRRDTLLVSTSVLVRGATRLTRHRRE